MLRTDDIFKKWQKKIRLCKITLIQHLKIKWKKRGGEISLNPSREVLVLMHSKRWSIEAVFSSPQTTNVL